MTKLATERFVVAWLTSHDLSKREPEIEVTEADLKGKPATGADASCSRGQTTGQGRLPPHTSARRKSVGLSRPPDRSRLTNRQDAL